MVTAPVRAQTSADRDRPFDKSITSSELLEKARQAYGLGKDKLAETFYQELLIRNEADVQSMLELSAVYERMQRLEYARGLLLRAAKLAPGNAVITERKARVEKQLGVMLDREAEELISAGQYEQAIPKISLHISFDPDDASLYASRSHCLLALGRYDAARLDVDQALRLDQAESYLRLRAEITKAVQRAEAASLKQDALRLAGSPVPADHRKAIAALGELLQLTPDDQWARQELDRLSALTKAAPDPLPVGTESEPAAEPATSALTDLVAQIGLFLEKSLGLLLAFLAILIVFKSPVSRALLARIHTVPQLSGQLERFSLPEILLMLNAEPHNGVLHVKGEGCRGKIYIENGEPCHCSVGKLDGREALIHLLNKSETGSFVFSEGALPIERSIETPLSLLLIERAKSALPRQSVPDAPKKSRMKELLDSKS